MHCKNYIQILLTPKTKYNGWTREPKLSFKFFNQSMPLHHNDIWVQICFFMSHEEMYLLLHDMRNCMGNHISIFPLALSICPLTSQSLSPLFFWGKISPNFNLKNMILTYTKDLPWRKWPKFAPDFKYFFIKITRWT